MVKIKLEDYIGKFLPSYNDTCFCTNDGSDIKLWLEKQGYEVKSNRDTGRNGEAVTKSGIVVCTNGYVYLRTQNLNTIRKVKVNKIEIHGFYMPEAKIYYVTVAKGEKVACLMYWEEKKCGNCFNAVEKYMDVLLEVLR